MDLNEKIFKNNKYTKWYFSIVSQRKVRIFNKNIYMERHHIIPKSLGGSNDAANMIKLTAKEHFLVHWLLTKMCIEDSHIRKMKYAMRSMSWNKTGNKIISSWQFELSRKKLQNQVEIEIYQKKLEKNLAQQERTGLVLKKIELQ